MADQPLTENSIDLSKLKVPDLKKELKQRGLNVSGNKTELLERLQVALKSTDKVRTESVDDLEEDLLNVNDEDDEHLDASESVILDTDLDETPASHAVKRKIEETENETKAEPSKKVVLNRNNSLTLSTDDEDPTPTKKIEKIEVKASPEKNEEKKVIKFSELTAKERLEMRAKKFGVTTVSPDAKRAVRAERFGTANTSAISITSSKVNTHMDVLKQRAARFGGSVSTTMSSLENKEKLEKRKQRFSSDSTVTTNGIPETDKIKLRLERFKEPVK